jgi:hypothetical protein
MRKGLHILIGALALGFVGSLPAAHAEENQGFIYGTVETTNGNTYRGILRWGREESFWDDHFNAAKDDMPYRRRDFEDRDDRDDRHRRRIRVFGITVGYDWDRDDGGRHFVARFGDLRKLEIHGGDRLTATMRNGERYELDGGSNDIGATIRVHDESLGDVKLEWRRIESITFSAVPQGTPVPARRLHGKLATEDGKTFDGFIQWDLEECLWTDELDGESEDGDLSIEMGRIQTIEKRNRNGAWVTLKDGRRLLLEGTNDVDHSTSGIFVEDQRLGRVRVRWDAFLKVDFEDTARTGRGYDDYKPATPLTGRVTDRDGKSHSGRIVFDLDEAESFEMLEGNDRDLEYVIPFELVRSIEPDGWDASRVTLASGLELELDDTTDVSDDNDGVLVFEGDKETYVAWRDVKRIDFD